MSEASDTRLQWLDRAHAVGRAQARHLWLTLIAAVFFFALKNSSLSCQDVTVPIVDLKLNAEAVLAAGPAILALLLVATLGSMKAWARALEEYAGEDWAKEADRLDLSPTLVDFALSATGGSPPALVEFFKLIAYPGYLTLVLVESGWLYLWLLSADVSGSIGFLIVGAPLLLGATFLVARMWLVRGNRFWKAWRAG